MRPALKSRGADRSKWRIQPIDEHGKRKSMVFDSYKTARSEEHRFNARVEEVRLGPRAETRIDKTFGELADYSIDNRAKRKRSCKDDESIKPRPVPILDPLLLLS